MISLHQLLNLIDLNCELAIHDADDFKLLTSGYSSTIELPQQLYDAVVDHILPGIVTQIYIKEF